MTSQSTFPRSESVRENRRSGRPDQGKLEIPRIRVLYDISKGSTRAHHGQSHRIIQYKLKRECISKGFTDEFPCVIKVSFMFGHNVVYYSTCFIHSPSALLFA